MKFTVTKTRVGVNMGDHAEGITTAHDVPEDMTVGELVTALLSAYEYVKGERRVGSSRESFLTIRVVLPLDPEKDTEW